MSLLHKKIAALTPKEKDELNKPLGVKGRPYPTRKGVMVKHKNGKESMANRITLLENSDNPVLIPTDKDYATVLGQAMRNMPTPAMLPIFIDGLNRRKLSNKRSIQFLKGAAGAGKTFMAEFTANMRDQRGPIIIDCGQKNLAELLYETVLDFNQDKKFYSELDKRLASGNVNPLSIQLLKDNLGLAATEKDGTLTIDWEKVGRSGEDAASSKTQVRKALQALHEVSRLEGLDNMGGNALGMATQEGPLIKAWKEGREIILDEFNRGKKGSTSSLHSVLQFFVGERSEVTVENTLKEKGENEAAQTFTFKLEDRRAGFFVTLTGNAEEDGDDVDELPQSVSSRIMPQTVPVATQKDWQHRICQIMTGMPISTIYFSKPDQWDKNPDLLREKLKEWRGMGLSQEERDAIPAIQMKLLERWEDVLEASEKLAKFYYTWAELTNPDSKLYENGENANIMLELSDTYFRETTVDFRKIGAHLGEALEARAHSILPEESDGYEEGPSNTPPVVDKKDTVANPARYYGSSLREVIEREVIATSRDLGKENLYRQLETIMKNAGLKEVHFEEARASENATIEMLLNEDPYTNRNPKLQASMIRDMLVAFLREFSNEKLSDNNDALLSVNAVLNGMNKIVQKYDEELSSDFGMDDNGTARRFFTLNDDDEGVSFRPFIEADIVDSGAMLSFDENGSPVDNTIDENKMLSQNDVLIGLTLPRLRELTLSSLWDKSLSDNDLISDNLNGVRDEGMAIAQGVSKSDLKMTSFAVKSNLNKGKEANLHLIFNEATGKSIVVGEKPNLSLSENFNACAVTFVDRAAADAEAQFNRALKSLLSNQDDARVAERDLCNAFMVRNEVPSAETQPTEHLADFILAKDTFCVLPQYILKK